MQALREAYRKAKEEHPDAIILIKCGDFYEAFFDDARLVAKTLGLTLTSRAKGDDAMPMTGFPYHQLDKYVNELATHGYTVEIATGKEK